eukprot:scaffold1636_cov165-Ochromonas_danica.AAC.1
MGRNWSGGGDTPGGGGGEGYRGVCSAMWHRATSTWQSKLLRAVSPCSWTRARLAAGSIRRLVRVGRQAAFAFSRESDVDSWYAFDPVGFPRIMSPSGAILNRGMEIELDLTPTNRHLSSLRVRPASRKIWASSSAMELARSA